MQKSLVKEILLTSKTLASNTEEVPKLQAIGLEICAHDVVGVACGLVIIIDASWLGFANRLTHITVSDFIGFVADKLLNDNEY